MCQRRKGNNDASDLRGDAEEINPLCPRAKQTVACSDWYVTRSVSSKTFRLTFNTLSSVMF
uniref:Uncharacterized protein n=1 Tax=Anguilla anguilla TaxID=7936 RepID=A0A0E9RQH1_ANGAN